ncbi:antibiotic biosynthesis monooxygenase family protein [Pontibacter actiniarum]|uniref:ABM domain-containing protein n=1 Tax=Pontibacter actiniarum TaxID=323450 RepID=A0A1X9YRK0_9BACT|nr:DUF4286 family protein [Pontibacter actiniarum]ARS35482.1 hypothetical protein CA264_08535 [Pontibacter actiniarum]
MITRHWTGQVKPAEAENYLHYLREELFPKLRQLKGYLGASVQRREAAGATEFLVISSWQSMEDISRFAGEKAAVAVVSEKAQRMMVSFEKEVRHYEVAYAE